MPAPYYSETDKAREIIDTKYLQGEVVDFGCGEHPITSRCCGVDARPFPCVTYVTDEIENFIGGNFDCAYSSHCLEHLRNPYAAIFNWGSCVKPGGYFILYLPDRRKYSNEGNPEHMNDWDMDSFMFYFRRVFCGEGKDFRGHSYAPMFRVIECKEDFRPDCYSFLVIAQKL